jgi:hypothetical protein
MIPRFKEEISKDKIDELATNSKNKNIRDLYTGINYFKKGYQPRSNLVNKIRVIKSRRMRWAGMYTNGEKRNAYRILVRKPEGKRPLGRTTHKWVDNIKWILER